jgi:hypothetical protein
VFAPTRPRVGVGAEETNKFVSLSLNSMIRARRRRNHRRISYPRCVRQYPDIARRIGAIAPEQAWLTGEVMKASGRSASARPKIALSQP